MMRRIRATWTLLGNCASKNRRSRSILAYLCWGCTFTFWPKSHRSSYTPALVSTHEPKWVDRASGRRRSLDPPLPVRTARQHHVDRGTRTQFNQLNPLDTAFLLSVGDRKSVV